MKRCSIDGSALLEDDGRILCLAAGHVLRDDVGLLAKMVSNSTPEDADNAVRPGSHREYPTVDITWAVPYTSPIRDELSDDALGHHHSEKLIGSADQ